MVGESLTVCIKGVLGKSNFFSSPSISSIHLKRSFVGFSLWKGSKSGLELLTPVVDLSTWEVGFEFEDFPGIALATTVSGGGLSLEFSTWEVFFGEKNPIPGCGDRFGFATMLVAVA